MFFYYGAAGFLLAAIQNWILLYFLPQYLLKGVMGILAIAFIVETIAALAVVLAASVQWRKSHERLSGLATGFVAWAGFIFALSMLIIGFGSAK